MMGNAKMTFQFARAPTRSGREETPELTLIQFDNAKCLSYYSCAEYGGQPSDRN